MSDTWAVDMAEAITRGGGARQAESAEVFMPAELVSLDPLSISLHNVVVSDQVYAAPALLTSIPPAAFEAADTELKTLGATETATLIRHLKDFHKLASLQPGDTVMVKEYGDDLIILGKVAMEL